METMLYFWPGLYTLVVPTPTKVRISFGPHGGSTCWKYQPMLQHVRALIGLSNPPLPGIVLDEAASWWMDRYEERTLDFEAWDSEAWATATVLVE